MTPHTNALVDFYDQYVKPRILLMIGAPKAFASTELLIKQISVSKMLQGQVGIQDFH